MRNEICAFAVASGLHHEIPFNTEKWTSCLQQLSMTFSSDQLSFFFPKHNIWRTRPAYRKMLLYDQSALWQARIACSMVSPGPHYRSTSIRRGRRPDGLAEQVARAIGSRRRHAREYKLAISN